MNDFEWIHIRHTAKHRIVCADNQIKDKMVKFLEGIGCKFNTYANKDTKKSAFIIRGVSYDVYEDNITAIKDSFVEFGVADIDNVTRFMTPAMERAESPPKFFQVVFNPQANIENLKQWFSG